MKVLLPLDGSKVGEAAVPYVEKLVSMLSPEVKAEVTLLQVVSSLTHYVVAGEASARIPYTEEEMEQIRKKAIAYLNITGKVLKSKGAKVKVKAVIGKTAEEIIRVADEVSANLIAMSTHGRSGLSRWAFGSVTDRVLRRGRRPVLVVRVPKEEKKT